MIEISNLTKSFEGSDGKVDALKNVSLTVESGDIYGIIGMSGAGKSTLVRCMNLLESSYDGTISFDGVDLKKLKPKELRVKRKKIAMIFQSFNLLMQKTCLKNVMFALELTGVKGEVAKNKALELLDVVGIKDKANAYPVQLSGGQQQRVAIARALASDPNVLICDEATSALDPSTTKSILALIRDINKTRGITVVMITHQMSVVEEICNKVTILENGEVAESGLVEDVFSSPKSKTAKKLVLPDIDAAIDNIVAGEQTVLRVVFNGAKTADTPVIAKMAIDIGVMANIMYAQTKTIGEKTYGTMILGLNGDEKKIAAAKKYLTDIANVICEEVETNG